MIVTRSRSKKIFPRRGYIFHTREISSMKEAIELTKKIYKYQERNGYQKGADIVKEGDNTYTVYMKRILKPISGVLSTYMP